MADPSTQVRSSPPEAPEDEPVCWLVVLPFLSQAALVVVVGGYADLHTAPALRAQLLDTLVHKRDALVLDLHDVEFCDLHGLDALHDVVEAAEATGTTVTLRGTSERLAWLQAAFPRRPPSRRSVGPCAAPPAAPADHGEDRGAAGARALVDEPGGAGRAEQTERGA